MTRKEIDFSLMASNKIAECVDQLLADTDLDERWANVAMASVLSAHFVFVSKMSLDWNNDKIRDALEVNFAHADKWQQARKRKLQ